MKTEWQARSNWNLIVVALPNGDVKEIYPDTRIELQSGRKLTELSAKGLMDLGYQLSYRKGDKDPWGTAVRMIFCLVLQRSMKLYSPSGRLIGRARLAEEKRSIH